jgi:hypothetical protein
LQLFADFVTCQDTLHACETRNNQNSNDGNGNSQFNNGVTTLTTIFLKKLM